MFKLLKVSFFCVCASISTIAFGECCGGGCSSCMGYYQGCSSCNNCDSADVSCSSCSQYGCNVESSSTSRCEIDNPYNVPINFLLSNDGQNWKIFKLSPLTSRKYKNVKYIKFYNSLDQEQAYTLSDSNSYAFNNENGIYDLRSQSIESTHNFIPISFNNRTENITTLSSKITTLENTIISLTQTIQDLKQEIVQLKKSRK